MALNPGRPIRDIEVDTVFLGSCTNARIEDLRAAARVLEGHKVKEGIRAMVVPGSMRVKKQAEEEGLAEIFTEAGFDWRNAGCSMCLGMNPDILQPGERCASTSQPQLRGAPGQGRQDAPRQPRRRRGDGRRGPVRLAERARRTIGGGIDGARRARIEGKALPLGYSDVDTDQIVPSDALKRIERTGFGQFLFSSWREDEDFIMHKQSTKMPSS